MRGVDKKKVQVRAAVRGLVRLAAVGVLALLTACVTPSGPSEAIHVAVDAWARAGRFAITVVPRGGDGQTQAVQGGFIWRDDGRNYRLDLTNPLGSTEARVSGQPGGALLVRANGSYVTASNPDALAEDALGSPVPVGGLRDWLRGHLSASRSIGLERDDQGRPESFGQDGWQVSLSRYDAQGPQLLVLRRREPDRDISVRLVVNAPSP